jgi:hypothetical protein
MRVAVPLNHAEARGPLQVRLHTAAIAIDPWKRRIGAGMVGGTGLEPVTSRM